MNIIGELIQMLPLQTGTGKNGEWKKQDIIIETKGQYPKKVCIAIWGDKINTSVLKIGNELDVSCDVESREFNGKWYTDVKAWKVELTSATTGATNSGQDLPMPDITEIPDFNDSTGDLPF
ncbi:MAG: DUF3127 domain-containing protein [Bacteroidia bacterium]|nr:DUF3127 domain-containing protein [Bacteroidia bacterium]